MNTETEIINKLSRKAQNHGLHVNVRRDNLIYLYNSIGDEIELFKSKQYENSLEYTIKINNKTEYQEYFYENPDIRTIEQIADIALRKYNEMSLNKGHQR